MRTHIQRFAELVRTFDGEPGRANDARQASAVAPPMMRMDLDLAVADPSRALRQVVRGRSGSRRRVGRDATFG